MICLNLAHLSLKQRVDEEYMNYFYMLQFPHIEIAALYYSSNMLPFTFSNSNCCDLADMYLQEEGDWKSVEIGQEKKTRTCVNGRYAVLMGAVHWLC